MITTLDLYSKLLRSHVFSFSDIEGITGDKKKANNAIYKLKKNGLIVSVKKNLYSAVSLSDKRPVADKFEIASKITSSSFVSHHSAFEFYGIANQVFNEMHVSSDSKFNDFYFDGLEYKYIQNKYHFGITEIKHVKVTDMERTVLDSIKDFEKKSGLEEVLQCISLVKFIDEKKLTEYLAKYDNNFLYQKTGFILRHFSSLHLSDNFFEHCKKAADASIRYLCRKDEAKSFTFDKEWNLCIPSDLNKILNQGDFADV